MTESYQIFIRPGFTGDSEGREFVQRVMKRIKDKPVVADDKHGWLDYAMYPCASKAEVKNVIEDIIKSGKRFWGSGKDLFITINDDTRQFYPSGEHNTKANPSESDWEGFVLVDIISGSKKKNPGSPSNAASHKHHGRYHTGVPVHKKQPERTTPIDMKAFSTGQFKWGTK